MTAFKTACTTTMFGFGAIGIQKHNHNQTFHEHPVTKLVPRPWSISMIQALRLASLSIFPPESLKPDLPVIV
jgi:hypothetical protein